jgi:hypothetical protein
VVNVNVTRIAVLCITVLSFCGFTVNAESNKILDKPANYNKQKKANDEYINTQITVLKSLPFAMAFEASEVILSIAELIVRDMDERLDVPLLELSEFYFGESLRKHEEGAINRGYRMISKINTRLQRGGRGCSHLSEQARKFLNNGGAEGSFRCKNAEAVKKTREAYIRLIRQLNGKPHPYTSPYIYDTLGFSKQRRYKDIAASNQSMVIDLPFIQASYLRTKGKVGWPEWFRMGAFIEVLAREPHPSMDMALLELRDFSMGQEADESMQRALLYRLEHFPRFAALVQAHMAQAPTWLGYPLLVSDLSRVKSALPSFSPPGVAIEALNPYGVKALTQAERNVELQKLLVMFKAR